MCNLLSYLQHYFQTLSGVQRCLRPVLLLPPVEKCCGGRFTLLRDVEAGEELCYDYGHSYEWDMDEVVQ